MKTCMNCHIVFDAEVWGCPRCGFVTPSLNGYRYMVDQPHNETETFNPEIFEAYAAIDSSHFWFTARNALIVDLLTRHFPAAKSMLDIGCGTGSVLQAIRQSCPAMNLFAADLSPVGLGHVKRKNLNATLLCMNAMQIPFASHFDVIGAFDVIEHIVDDCQVLEEMYRALVPGGGILLTVPQHPWLWSKPDEYAGHVRRYTRRNLLDKVRHAGFHIERVTSFVSLLLPLMAASRLKQRLRAAKKEQVDEGFTQLPCWLNRAFERIMAFERNLIRKGWNLPIGGSLIVVASKPATAATGRGSLSFNTGRGMSDADCSKRA
ncbi:class I SAM-dependent methyltransferase [Herbaspirillum aquaticum]|uniref:class I SAM-dependent methyltransferase n=1 Tax=Herbaspirillum aquaticum TaxID=568783 RepID=UPI0024DE9A3B|nr:class I SAM-dependent methyltransferase [Herbaspirillum aquaticum]